MINRKKKRYKLIGAIVVVLIFLSVPEIIHRNSGVSTANGSVRAGSLTNGYLLPYRGKNFNYFSPFSYFILNNAYTHHAVHNTILDAYKICETTVPGVKFRLMETSNQDGGRLHFHRTHQNGTSADFMSPKKNRKGQQVNRYDWIGLSHYLLNFDDEGKIQFDTGTTIDFESMALHILALHEAAAKNGLSIRKVILRIGLKDELYATTAGAQIKAKGIYIVQNLTHIVNVLHDDHYHVDFNIAK